jgi:hypothetical protein
MQHRPVMLAAIAGLAVLGPTLTGCGGARPAVPPAAGQLSGTGGQHWPADRRLAGLHACALIPAATVAATLGQLEEPPTESPDGLTCFYNTRASSQSAGPSYILDILKRSLYEVAKSLADGEAKARLVQLVPIRGIGDEGYATADSAGGPQYNVSVAKGGAAAAVQVNSVHPAAETQAERLLAAVAARL